MATLEDSFNAVELIKAQFPWLANLGENIINLLINLVQEDTPSASIVAEIRNTPEYKARFPGMEARRLSGYNAINEAEYLAVEDAYRSQLRSYGILGVLAPNESAFREFAADFISKDVSVAELNRRLDQGVAIARDLAPGVQEAFRDFYGVEISPDALLMYALDPERGTNLIESQVATAVIGGEALKYGLNISRTRADLLRQRGVDASLARQGFASVAREKDVLNSLAKIHQFTPFEQEELEDFFFHEDPEVGKRRYQVFTQELANFQGRSASRTQEGGLSQLVDFRRTI